MLKRNFFQILILFVITGFLVSCATTTETFILKDKEYNGGKFDSILIIGIAENVENRILFENTFAETFQKKGITTYTSVKAFPPEQKLTKESIKQKALGLGVKGVILTHLVSVTEEEVYKKSAAIKTLNVHHDHMGVYYAYVDERSRYPGSYKKQQVVRLKTNLYETASEKLVFSISSKTMDPKSVNDLINSTCEAYVKDLEKNDLI
jgi:hypothetical protein